MRNEQTNKLPSLIVEALPYSMKGNLTISMIMKTEHDFMKHMSNRQSRIS
jgi:hypothetical protein